MQTEDRRRPTADRRRRRSFTPRPRAHRPAADRFGRRAGSPPSPHRVRAGKFPRTGRYGANLAAAVIVVFGLLDVASGVRPGLAARLVAVTTIVPPALAHAASAATVVTGVLLVMTGHGLRRRKRRAWRTALVLLAASVVLHLVHGLQLDAAVAAAVLAALLVLLRDQFHAEGDPRTRWRAVAAFLALSAASVAVGLGLLYSRAAAIVGPDNLWLRFREIVLGLVWCQRTTLLPRPGRSRSRR